MEQSNYMDQKFYDELNEENQRPIWDWTKALIVIAIVTILYFLIA